MHTFTLDGLFFVALSIKMLLIPDKGNDLNSDAFRCFECQTGCNSRGEIDGLAAL